MSRPSANMLLCVRESGILTRNGSTVTIHINSVCMYAFIEFIAPDPEYKSQRIKTNPNGNILPPLQGAIAERKAGFWKR